MKTAYKSIVAIILVGLLVSLLPIPPAHAQPEISYIIVHAHNPEGVEIASIQGVGQGSVQIYDGDTFIGYGAYNSATHNQPITISTGSHTIKVKFNGMTMEQFINMSEGETQVLTFTFESTEFNLKAWLDSEMKCDSTSQASGTHHFQGHSWEPYEWDFYDGEWEYIPNEEYPMACTSVVARHCAWGEGWGNPASYSDMTYDLIAIIKFNGTFCEASYHNNIEISGNCGVYAEFYTGASLNGYIPVTGFPKNITGFDNWYVQSDRTKYPGVYISEEEYSNGTGLWATGYEEGGPASGYCTRVIPANKNYSYAHIPWGIGFVYQPYWTWEALYYPFSHSHHASESWTGTLNQAKMSSVPYDLTGTGVGEEVNQPPVASFTYSPAKPMVGGNIIFDASASYDPDGTIVSYQWDFGDGNSAEGEVVTHDYSEPNEYVVTLTVTDDDGLTGSTQKKIRVFARCYVLCVGVRVPGGDNIADDIQAQRVRDAFARLPGVARSDLLILSADNSNNTSVLTSVINNAANELSSEDTFIMYIGAHGFFAGGYDEPGVWAQYDVNHLDWRTWTTEDEHFYLSKVNFNDNISDDTFSNLFIGPPWPNVNKLFIVDTCYAGGFWGNIAGLDSGDLGRLSRVYLIPAAPEANFAGTVYDPTTGVYVGKLGKALVDALNCLPYSYHIASIEDLLDVLLHWGNTYRGLSGPIKDFTQNWGVPIETDFDIQPRSSPDFHLNLQVRRSLIEGDLDDDIDVDLGDFALFANHWLDHNCEWPNWCEGADLDKSEGIDFFDLQILAEHWLEGL